MRSGCSWPYKIKVHQPQRPPRNPPKGWKAEDHAQLLALKKDGTQSKSLHELRMKKQHKNRAKKKQKRRPGL